MGHRHTKEEILDAAMTTALDTGLSQLTFGRVAKTAATSDRVVVYYFPTKDDLIGEVLFALGAQLQETLVAAPQLPATDHVTLMRMFWPAVTTPKADRVFALFFEANGLATVGREPYASLVPQFVTFWVSWAERFIDDTPEVAKVEAETAVAIVDGLLLLRLISGEDAANRVAVRLGIVD